MTKEISHLHPGQHLTLEKTHCVREKDQSGEKDQGVEAKERVRCISGRGI